LSFRICRVRVRVRRGGMSAASGGACTRMLTAAATLKAAGRGVGLGLRVRVKSKG